MFLYRQFDPALSNQIVAENEREHEITQLKATIRETHQQLKTLRNRIAMQVGESIARIFDSQTAILDDNEFIGSILARIQRDGLTADAAIFKTAEAFNESFSALDEDLFKDRAIDVRDVARRMIRNILGKTEKITSQLDKPAILVTDDLLPSDVIHLLRDNVQAVATDMGGAASHTAILTRSLEIPSVLGLRHVSSMVQNGDRIVVNGNSGKVIIHPTGQTVESYETKRTRYQSFRASLKDIEELPAETLDGKKIALRSNIELPSEAATAIARGAEGIGLFRSEYLFLSRNKLPNEDEQVTDYKKVIECVKPHPVTIRTFDLGGDKIFPDFPQYSGDNPFMGWRAIRVSLAEPKLLRTQIRAVLRASASGPTRLMFPLISGLKEVRQIKHHFEEVKQELTLLDQSFDKDCEVGIMIELPSAVMMAEELAREVDFFSIGTNDLTQFSLAVDRGNERIKDMYQPLHPALLRMIRMTIEAGHKAGIKVGLCGELAANPLATMLLVGLDIDELSVSPIAIAEIKKIIRSMNYSDAVSVTKKALKLDTHEELREFCEETLKARFADLPIWFNS